MTRIAGESGARIVVHRLRSELELVGDLGAVDVATSMLATLAAETSKQKEIAENKENPCEKTSFGEEGNQKRSSKKRRKRRGSKKPLAERTPEKVNQPEGGPRLDYQMPTPAYAPPPW